ncbi:MAG: tryptophan--tRNA ligase [Candidatus Pacebacteria bacterium]|nr:tryptophan--tRNA ligase [Candidatus Paceibacterota bacterium]
MIHQEKPTIFSGVQPSGNLHLGNYLGAISRWANLQDKNQCIFCVVDYHAITIKQDPLELKKNIIETAKIYLASGIDPKKSIIFQQSQVSEHTELAWILNCVSARMSDLNKMTQYKDKAEGNENVSVGLFDYPVLMASDILLYNTDLVPTGEDQKQHVELSRTLAKRFNSQYKELFRIPEPLIERSGARIMGLDDAFKKMSKSAKSEFNYIGLLDSPEQARKKIMKAVTDTGSEIKYDKENKPAISNLLTIYSLLSKKTIKELEVDYKGRGYGDFKKDLAEVVINFLSDFQKRYNKISDKEVVSVLLKGKKKAKNIAEKKLSEVKKSLGVL